MSCHTLCSQVCILKWPHSNLRALLFYCRCFSFSAPSESALPSRLTQSSFFLSPSLSSFSLSDDVSLCQWGGAEGERRNESGSQEAMHLKSPLRHNKTEIHLWLASSPIPFSSEQMQTDGRICMHTHTRTYTHSVQKELCLLDQVSSEQSSRCTHAEVHFPAPESQFCSPAAASKHFPKL